MSTWVQFAGREIDLAHLSSADYRAITGLHRQVRRGDNVLLCLQSGIADEHREMHIRMRGGRFFAAHFAGGGHGEHVISRESDEHKRQKHYWLRAGEDAGFRAALEVRTSRDTVLDVGIYGAQDTGVEVQWSHLELPKARARTTKSHNAGWLPVWFTDAAKRPRWLHRIPSVTYADVSWASTPPPHGVTTAGPRRVVAKRCTPSEFPWCPNGQRRHCGSWHPDLELMRGLTVDDVAALVPAKRLVPASWRNNAVYLLDADSTPLHEELTGRPCSWDPSAVSGGRKRAPASVRAASRECASPRHSEPGQPVPSPRQTQPSPSDNSTETASAEARADPQAEVRRQRVEYERLGRSTGAGKYPADGTCSLCGVTSPHPLVAWPSGWRCRVCTYPLKERY